MPGNPWELKETAISCGFDPASLTEWSARRRTGDAGHGRDVMVPVYLRRESAPGFDPRWAGLLVRLPPGGGLTVDRALLPRDLADLDGFWRTVHRARGGAVDSRGGWTRVDRGVGAWRFLVLRDTDWLLLRTALTLRDRGPSGLQDAPVERVLARFLGRLDGVDGTLSAGLWGRLALEVVSVRKPNRLADTRSLRWHASWGPGGFSASSGGRSRGSARSATLLDLTQQRFHEQGRPFRVRTLPDWEREAAAYDLGLSPRLLLAWPTSSLAALLAFFADIAPAPLAAEGPQDAR